MKLLNVAVMMFCLSCLMPGCGADRVDFSVVERKDDIVGGGSQAGGSSADTPAAQTPFGRKSRIADVMADTAFGSYGRLLFPVQRGYWSGETLEELRLSYYNYIDPDMTVEIVLTNFSMLKKFRLTQRLKW